MNNKQSLLANHVSEQNHLEVNALKNALRTAFQIGPNLTLIHDTGIAQFNLQLKSSTYLYRINKN